MRLTFTTITDERTRHFANIQSEPAAVFKT